MSTDERRLAWLGQNWGGQRADFASHVLARGGTGDLSDIRTFVDAAMPPPKRCKACREVGMIHCSDPLNCGGPWDGRPPQGVASNA